MSARSYHLRTLSYDNVTTRRERRFYYVRLHGTDVVKVDLVKGKCLLRHGEYPSATTATAMNRFFSLIGCKRLSVVRRGGGLYLVDSKANISRDISSSGITTPIPTKGVMRILSACKVSCENIETWLQDILEEELPRRLMTYDEIPF